MEVVKAEVGKVVVGMEEALESLVVSLLTGGHVIMEGVPGLAKTLLAKSFAKSLGLSFKRIQFTVDILPSDIIGGLVFNRKTGELEFRPGPLFANVVLIDEINRAPPRSQSALLEAMQERQVTVEGVTYRLPEPFLVIATQNPVELEGTFPLPEAEIDRFMMRVLVSYPSREEEMQILRMRNVSGEEIDVNVVVDRELLTAASEEVRKVTVVPQIIQYIVDIVSRSRSDERLVIGASPRAEIALLYAAKALAALDNRTYVIPDDVKKACFRVLNHRLVPKPEYVEISKRIDYGFISTAVKEYYESVEVPL
ncbi:MAG: AAA family ATPase [Candidatus Caldarchaeum sp.]|nr:AAA family ATPase [Candidatus Caldarchaeum sp.]MDW8434716.1 AAA family ATPase [Candidatus Caldarchaeum sp.]